MTDMFKRTGDDDFDRFLKVLVTGPPKSGKTTLLGTVPGILILDTEPHANNMQSVKHLDLPVATITSTDDLRHAASILSSDSLRRQLAQERYGMPDIQAVAIDTLDTLQKIMKAERLKEQRQTQFLRDDWGWLKTEMEAIVQMFTALPLHVFFMVHTKTKEIGKGDDAYTVVQPGLEGAIAESIAGMVGYSLLSFRKEEVGPNGTFTKYWLQTEGDRTYDFLGTRTAGRLPTIIEPDMATIWQTVQAGKPQRQAPVPVPTPSSPPEGLVPPGEEVAQTPIQEQSSGPAVPTAVETQVHEHPGTGEQMQGVEHPADGTMSPPVGNAPVEPSPAEPPPAEKPGDGEPVNPAAIGHIKRVYDAIQQPLTNAVTGKLTMGDARSIVKMWQACLSDHQGEPDAQAKTVAEMTDILRNYGWLDDSEQPSQKAVEPKVDGTIDQVMAYVENDLAKVQEAYDLESAKGDDARTSLIAKLEGLGAKSAVPTAVETQPEPVTSEQPAADTPTEDEALATAQEALGAEVIGEELAPDAPCSVCGKPIDDYDLAKLGVKRFQKILCVNDYLAEGKK